MRRALLLLSLALLAGCATKPAPRPAPVPKITVSPAVRPITPAGYIAGSASRSLFLVRASEMAIARDPSLAALAARVAEAHRGVAAQLNRAGRRLDILPSAVLLPIDKLQLDGLSGSSNFAKNYRGLVAYKLRDCIADEGSYASSGTSPTLRPVARFALGVCRDQLATLPLQD